MTIKLTAKEKKLWREDYAYYIRMGYPPIHAEQRAWDHYYATHNKMLNKFKELFV